MKNYIYLTLIAAVMIFSGCESQLDLKPENTLVESDLFSSEAMAESALADAYNQFLTACLYRQPEGHSYVIGDVTTDVAVAGLPNVSYFNTNTVSPTDPVVEGIWAAYFKAINLANNMVQKIPVLGKYDETKEAQHIAEAKFIRAFCYLRLLSLFGDGALSGNDSGPGLPLQLKAFEGYEEGMVIPRNTNAEVFTQMIADLLEAIPDLPTAHNNDNQSRARATKGSAYALLSRVYLYSGEFANAADAAKKVIDNSQTYELVNDLLSVFPPNAAGTPQNLTKEHVFAFPVSQDAAALPSWQEGANLLGRYYSFGVFLPEAGFLAELDDADNRKAQLTAGGKSLKFNHFFGKDNLPLIRTAEVYLTRAEGLARVNGITQEAVDLLNAVRSRSWPGATAFTLADFANNTDLINAIVQERKLELAFEGHRRYDLLRTGGDLKTPETKKVLPIPQRDIDISENVIQQNPGY